MTVSDDGDPAKSSSAVVALQVSDVNEQLAWTESACAAGSTTKYAACFTIAENTLPTAGTATLGSIKSRAVDPDTLSTQTLSFTMTSNGNSFNDRAVFGIDASSGVISLLQNALDFEKRSTYELEVVATDSGSPSMSKGTKIHVSIVDVNEAPVIVSTAFDVAETAVAGAQVGDPISIADPDSQQTHTVSILSGNGPSNSWFAIAGNVIRLGDAPIDFEADGVSTFSTFSLTLQVTDSGSPAMSASKVVTVRVADRNEPPTINDAVREVDENSPVNADIGSALPASDPDAGQMLT